MSVVGRTLDQGWETLLGFLKLEGVSQPRVFAALVILVTGFIGGRIASEVLRSLLKMTSLDEFAVKSDVQPVLRKTGYSGTVSDLVSDLLKWFIYVLAALSVFYVFGFRFVARYSQVLIDLATRTLLASAVLVIGAFISEQLEEITVRLFRAGRLTGIVDETGAEIPVYVIAGRAVKYVGLMISLLVALGVFGVNLLVLNILIVLFGLGVVAVLVFGSRDLARNIAISIYLQLSRTFNAGDRIKVGDREGEVAGVRPLYTEIESGDRTFYIPNRMLLSEVVEREKGG